MLDRRDVLALAGAAALAGKSSDAHACSRPAIDPSKNLRAYFSAIARRDYAFATSLLAQNCRLSVVTLDKADMFETPKNINGTISNLLHSQGFHLLGDSRTRPGGGYWKEQGGWLCSDLFRGSTMKFESSTCANPGEVSDPVFNVRIRKNKAEKISLIVLLGSYQMTWAGQELPSYVR